MLVDPQTGNSLMVYNTRGQFEYALETPGLGSNSDKNAHQAGSGSNSPLVYFSWDPEQSLQMNSQGTISTLRSTNAFFGMAGANSQPALAFSEVLVDGIAPHSYLYAGNLDTIGSAAPFFDLERRDHADGFAAGGG